MNDRYLIINADDIGLDPGIDAGVVETVRIGSVTSVSVFVNPPHRADFPFFAESGVSIGLHLNLTQGFHCAPFFPASIVDGRGRFYPDGHERLAEFDIDDVRAEFEAQVERFRQASGILPSHLDLHKHLHMRDDRIFDVAMAIARGMGIPLRCPTKEMRRTCREHGVFTTDHFIGGVDPAPYWTVGRMLDTLAKVPQGVTEMMCHPGKGTCRIEGLRYAGERDTERKTLLSAEVRRLLGGLRLVNFLSAPFGADGGTIHED